MTHGTQPASDDDDACPIGPSLSPRWIPAVFAIALTLLGFGALNLESAVMDVAPKLRGLYTYRSATIGDGLLLPLLTYSIIRAASVKGPWPAAMVRAVAYASAIGAAIGIGIQVQWLASARTQLNWTIPSPHSFNFAGKYHAGFLILSCALFAAGGMALWTRMRTEPASVSQSRLHLPGATTVATPALAFIGLLGLDNSSGKGPFPVTAIIFFGASVLILYCLTASATRWRDIKACSILITASAIPASAILAIFWPGSVFEVKGLLLGVGAMFGGVVISSCYPRTRVTDRAIVATLIGLSLAAPLVVAADVSRVTSGKLLIAVAISLSLAASEWYLLARLIGVHPVVTREFVPALLAAGALLAVACSGIYLGATRQHIDTNWFAVGGLVLVLRFSAPWLYLKFAPVIAAEQADVTPQVLSGLKQDAYQAIAGMSGLAFTALLLFIMGTVPETKWNNGIWDSATVLMLIVSGAVLLALTGLMLGLLTVTSSGFAFGVAGLVIWSLLELSWLAVHASLDAAILGPAAFLSVVVGLFVAEGISGNTSRPIGAPVDVRVKTISILAGISAGSTLMWALGACLLIKGHPSNLLVAGTSLIICISAIQLLPYCASRFLIGSTAPTSTVYLAGVLQDSFISLLLVVFVGWIPLLVLAHIEDVSSWVAITILYGGYLSSAYVYIMRNNVNHVRDEFKKARKAATGPDLSMQQRWDLERLKYHCKRQNILALIALVPVIVAAIVVTAVEQGGFKPAAWTSASLKELLITDEAVEIAE